MYERTHGNEYEQIVHFQISAEFCITELKNPFIMK